MRWRRNSRRTVPTLNTTSTADISFMLLIFFLVTTSMDVDKGLTRQLPPINDEKQEQPMDVNKSNVLSVRLDANNRLFVNDEPANIQGFSQCVLNFLQQSKDLKTHIIQLDIDRAATYDTYFALQNDMVAAYRRLREQRARQQYGHKLSECTDAERENLRTEIPQRVTEIYHAPQAKGGQP